MNHSLTLSKPTIIKDYQHSTPALRSVEVIGNVTTLVKAESERFEKRMAKNYSLQESVTIPIPFNSSRNLLFKERSKLEIGNEGDGPSMPDAFDVESIKEALEVISKNLPESVKKLMNLHGFEVVNIAKLALEIPEYNKAIKNCNYVINEFKNDPSFPKSTITTKEGITLVEINKSQVDKKIKEIETVISASSKDLLPYNENSIKLMNEMEKYHQYNLANDFKNINCHHLTTTLCNIGIKAIRIVGNTRYVTLNDKVDKILKLTVSASSIVLEVYDKAMKSNLYKTDDPKNKDFTPSEYFDLKNIKARRNEVIDKNVGLMMNMVKNVQSLEIDNKKSEIVSALLKGFYCNLDEAKQKISMFSNAVLKEYIQKNMSKLYKL